MKIIAHRGNLNGPNPLRENSPDYIEEAIYEGFDVEIDLWVENDRCYLGHDDPQYFVTMEWLEKYKNIFWIHCKDREALEKISSSSIEFNYFYHEHDRYTLTSKGIGWVLVDQKPFKNAIVVLPELMSFYNTIEEKYAIIMNTKGICTDKPLFYQKELGVKK